MNPITHSVMVSVAPLYPCLYCGELCKARSVHRAGRAYGEWVATCCSKACRRAFQREKRENGYVDTWEELMMMCNREQEEEVACRDS